MAKFANSMMMKYIGLLFVLLAFVGCSSLGESGYIKSNHPYIRKISGDYEQIVEAVKAVLLKEGWNIQKQLNPSVYERRVGGEDQSQDILFITESKRISKVVYSSYSFLNVFIHAFADGAEVEIRYQVASPATFGIRNDKLINSLLDQIEHKLESK